MKKYLFLLMFFTSALFASAQTITQTIAHNYKWSGNHQFTKPVLMPVYTLSQMNAISNPVTGMIVLNKDSKRLYFFKDTAWFKLVP